ncbi:cytochrome c family protein [Pseudohalocynthiibacter sp. F2068]|jgi:cytochrome c2|uniref:c-type cytochrome n=1 Tax=Pseudohalocynthiibacter sp. F2068 TaxID=2926418 RepID=UPI001FF672AA|nr:cytochrome c family protein [Pseudohalocynthiibacter sp. F2068]MCK0100957.1 cytochrome c family protein [Pseudohalocynthiibacter sp. F2068]
MRVLVTCIALSATLFTTPTLAQDAEAGEDLFRRCASCHKIGEDAQNAVGPVLTGVIGRAAGSYEGYGYSRSMTAANEAGLVWSEETVFDYLENPTKYLRAVLDDPRARAKMSFKLRDEEDRRNVVAYLATFSTPMDEASAAEGETSVCVVNGSDETRLFAAESNGENRVTGTLAPGETLCSEGAGDGMVTVFEAPDHLEGCTRLVSAGGQDTLLKYADFDRCAWTSNTN